MPKLFVRIEDIVNNITQAAIWKITSCDAVETREVHLPERGMASVACQPGCSPSTPPCHSPFPLRVCSWAWTRGIVGTPSGFRQLTGSRPLPRESNENEAPPQAPRNYWMSSGKSTVPDDSPRNRPTIRSLASARRPPPRFSPLCTLACLWTDSHVPFYYNHREFHVDKGSFRWLAS